MLSKFNLSEIAFGASLTFLILVIFNIISVYFGNNPLNNSKYRFVDYVSLFPQGWAFFTKNSKDPLVYIYKYSENGIDPVIHRNFSMETNFGISRHNRVMLLESSHLLKKFLADDSIKFKIFKAIDIYQLEKEVKDLNLNFENINIQKEIVPNFKGKYIFIYQDLLPWSLIHKKREYKSTFRIYAIDVIQE